MSPRAKRILLIAGVAMTAWFALTVLWAVGEQTDAVPVGIDYTAKPSPVPLSIEVACNSLFDSAPRGDEPLPMLKAQPKDFPDLGFQREPCSLVHHNARLAFGIDVGTVVLTLGVGSFLVRRQRRSNELSPESVAAARA